MRDILETGAAIGLILGSSFILVGVLVYSLAWIVYAVTHPSPSEFWPIVHAVTIAGTIFVTVGSIACNKTE